MEQQQLTFKQVILQWCARQNHSQSGLHLVDDNRQCRFGVAHHMTLITHHQVCSRVQQEPLEVLPNFLPLHTLGDCKIAKHLIAHEDDPTMVKPPPQLLQPSIDGILIHHICLDKKHKSKGSPYSTVPQLNYDRHPITTEMVRCPYRCRSFHLHHIFWKHLCTP